MIAHLVLFRLKPGVRREDPRVRRWVAAMVALPGSIGSIRGWEHGWNETADEQAWEAWDYGLRALFDDREALEAYFAHPAHQPLLAQWEEIGELAFCDFGC